MRGKWNFLHHPRLTSGEKDVMYYNATDWNLNTMKNNKLKNCFVGIFHFIFGQLAYCSKRAKEANLKESDWGNHMVSIQSSNGYLFHSKAWFPFTANSTTTTQKTKRLCAWAVILPANCFVLIENWSLSWSKLALGLVSIKPITTTTTTNFESKQSD